MLAFINNFTSCHDMKIIVNLYCGINIVVCYKAMMENSVRMMLMGVTQYLVLKDNSVMTTLHHLLEQSVLVLMVMPLVMILNVSVSTTSSYQTSQIM